MATVESIWERLLRGGGADATLPRSEGAADTVDEAPTWRDAAALALLVALPWILFHRALGIWWADDDLEMLRFLRAHADGEYVWNPEVWRSLPGSVLTPFQFLSLHLDLRFFGLDPKAFYAHQLIALGAAACALFVALRRWWGRNLALLVSVLFLLGRPIVALAGMMSARHYAEAIACGALAVLLFERAVRTGSRRWAVASAVLALVAMGFKETAVPLPLMLAALPLGTRRRRLQALLPQAVAWLLYAAYRMVMLGPEVLKGYGFKLLPEDLPRHLVLLPWKALLLFVEPGGWGVGALVLLAAGITALALLRPRSLPGIALAGALALAPVIPVSIDLAPRYASTFWLVAVVAFGAGLAAWRERQPRQVRAAAALGCLTVLAFVAVERGAWSSVTRRAARSDAESRAFLRLSDGDVVRGPIAMAGFLGDLRRYRNEDLGLAGGPAWFEDDLALCLDRFAALRLWQFDPARREVVDVSARRGELRAEACGRIRWRAPLRARFVMHAEDFAWDLDAGPGDYALVLDDGLRVFPAPPRGAFHLPGPTAFRLRVRYADPAGWVTYSDNIDLRAVLGETVDWSRPKRRGARPNSPRPTGSRGSP